MTSAVVAASNAALAAQGLAKLALTGAEVERAAKGLLQLATTGYRVGDFGR